MTKILFLPHCLNQESLNKIKQEAKKRNYKTYIAGGSSAVKNTLNSYPKIDRIVGIACEDEIKLAKEYLKYLTDKKTEVTDIKLLKDGCKDTEVDMQEVIDALK